MTNEIELVYDLVNSEIATHWAELISQQTVDKCCKINHYTGYYDDGIINQRLTRLHNLADLINEVVPTKIEKVNFTKETYQSALNIMHVHFPEFKSKEGYEQLDEQLSEYNDIIHWLESILDDYYSGRIDHKNFSIKLDFNKVKPYKTYQFPESSYPLFNENLSFGQLMIHYVHVGRHAWELFFAKDLTCPKDQFVPQRAYNASARLHFFNNTLDSKENQSILRTRWEQFYKERGGKDFFGYDIDDPKIAFGYCHIGQLSQVKIDGTNIKVPDTIEYINDFRSKIVKTNIINWEIIKGA